MSAVERMQRDSWARRIKHTRTNLGLSLAVSLVELNIPCFVSRTKHTRTNPGLSLANHHLAMGDSLVLLTIVSPTPRREHPPGGAGFKLRGSWKPSILGGVR